MKCTIFKNFGSKYYRQYKDPNPKNIFGSESEKNEFGSTTLLLVHDLIILLWLGRGNHSRGSPKETAGDCGRARQEEDQPQGAD
jgi:hypothetical protein